MDNVVTTEKATPGTRPSSGFQCALPSIHPWAITMGAAEMFVRKPDRCAGSLDELTFWALSNIPFPAATEIN